MTSRTGSLWQCMDCGDASEDCNYLDEAETVPICVHCSSDYVRREAVEEPMHLRDDSEAEARMVEIRGERVRRVNALAARAEYLAMLAMVARAPEQVTLLRRQAG